MSLMVINPFVFAAVANLTITKVLDSTSTGSTTIDFPGGILSGDLIVMFDNCVGFATPTTVVPSGFTSIINSTDSFCRAICSYKIATGSESGALTGMTAGPLNTDKVMLVFRGSSPIASVTVGSAAGSVTNANPTAQVVSSSSGVAPLIVLGAYASAGVAINPRSFSPAKDGEVNSSSTFAYFAWKIYNTTPADVTIDMDDESNPNSLQSFYLAVA